MTINTKVFLRNIFLLSLIYLASYPLSAQTQTGPGGVGTSSSLSVWLDAGRTGLTAGDFVNTWVDVSGNNNNFNTGNPFTGPTLVGASASMNNRPVASFNGSNNIVQSSALSSLNSNANITWFTAASYTNNSITQVMLASKYTNSSSAIWSDFYSKPTNVIVTSTRNSSGGQVALTRPFSSVPHIMGSNWSGGVFSYYNDGQFINSNAGASFSPANHSFIRLGAQINGSTFYSGQIGEFIVFNNSLNLAQIIIVSNYLSTKYGVVMDDNDMYSYEATHEEELSGIGSEGAPNQHLSARGTGLVEVTASSLDNGDYLMWAHDDGDLSTTTTNIPSDYSLTSGERLERTWRFSEIGETGTLTISVDMTGIGFADEFDYHLIIDADGDFSDATLIDGIPNGDIITFTVDGSLLSDGSFVTIGSGQKLIRSIVDGQNWNQTSTWSCACIPAAPNAVLIDNGHTVTLSDVQNIDRFIINTTGEFNIISGGEISVSGNVDVLGTVNSTDDGLIIFDGTNAQIVNGGSVNFGSVNIDNSLGITLQTGTYSLSGVLSPMEGVFDINNNLFVFTSTATGTASIGVMTGIGTITGMGNVRVQRFIPNGVAGIRNIGTPLTMMPLSEWDDEIFISGPGFPDGCAFTTNGCYTSARYYRSDIQAYRGFTDIDSLLTNGSGLHLFVGNNLNTFSGATLTASGQLNTNLSTDITVRTGWNLISNPYLSPIDFDDIIFNSAGTGNYHYVYDPNSASMQYWDGDAQDASVSHLDNGILAAFQGFWVFQTGANSTITINQASKSIGSPDLFLRQSSGFKSMDYLTIELSNPALGHRVNSGIKFDARFESELDIYDLPKINVPLEEFESTIVLYTKTEEGKDVVVNSLPELKDCYTIPLYFDVVREGAYQFTFDNLPIGYTVTIKDKETNKIKVIENGSVIDFIQTGQLKNVNRFELIFEKNTDCIKNVDINTVDIYNVNNELTIVIKSDPFEYRVEIINTLGQNVIESTIFDNLQTINTIILPNYLSGIYIVKIVSTKGNIIETKKIFVK